MNIEQQEKLLNDFLHQLVVYKSIKIQKPICSNTIAQCVIDYLDLEKTKEIKKEIFYKFIGNPNNYGRGYIVGNMYSEYEQKDKFSSTIQEMAIKYPRDWELVTLK